MKEEALDRTVWRTRFGRVSGLRQTTALIYIYMLWILVVNFAMYMPLHSVLARSSPLPSSPPVPSVTAQFHRLLNSPPPPALVLCTVLYIRKNSLLPWLSLAHRRWSQEFPPKRLYSFAKLHRFTSTRVLLARFKHYRMLRHVVRFIDFDISIMYCFSFWVKSGLRGWTVLHTLDPPTDHC